MRLRYPIVLLTALLLTTPAPASAGDAPKAKVYKTPQAAFNALLTANKAGDWKTVCDCLTPQSRDMYVGVLVMAGGEMDKEMDAALAKETDADKRAFMKTIMDQMMKPIRETYSKHGVTAKQLKAGGMAKLKAAGEDPEKLKKLLADAARPVKNGTAFIVDFMGAMKKIMAMAGKAKEGAFDIFPADGKLEDVNIEGDSAKATVVGTKGGAEKRSPVTFKKYMGGWRVELPLDPKDLLGKKQGSRNDSGSQPRRALHVPAVQDQGAQPARLDCRREVALCSVVQSRKG